MLKRAVDFLKKVWEWIMSGRVGLDAILRFLEKVRDWFQGNAREIELSRVRVLINPTSGTFLDFFTEGASLEGGSLVTSIIQTSNEVVVTHPLHDSYMGGKVARVEGYNLQDTLSRTRKPAGEDVDPTPNP